MRREEGIRLEQTAPTAPSKATKSDSEIAFYARIITYLTLGNFKHNLLQFHQVTDALAFKLVSSGDGWKAS